MENLKKSSATFFVQQIQSDYIYENFLSNDISSRFIKIIPGFNPNSTVLISQKLRLKKKNSRIKKSDSEHCASFKMRKKFLSVKTLENCESSI